MVCVLLYSCVRATDSVSVRVTTSDRLTAVLQVVSVSLCPCDWVCKAVLRIGTQQVCLWVSDP